MLGLKCAGCPLVVQVMNPANKMSLQYGNATKCVAVGQTVWATINMAGYAYLIPPEAIVPIVVGVYFTSLPTSSFSATKTAYFSVSILYNVHSMHWVIQ